MKNNSLKKFNIYNTIFCLIFSIIVFFLFNNISFFNNLLGEVNIGGGTGASKPLVCNDYFFCRAPTIPYLYYYLLNTFNIDFVIFLQIFILISTTFLI